MPRPVPFHPVPTSPAPRDLPPVFLAYCAATFDAVGTVRITRVGVTAAHFGLGIRHKVRGVRDGFLTAFGGRINYDGSWYASGEVATAFIEAVRPYLRTYGSALDSWLAARAARGEARQSALVLLALALGARSTAPLTTPPR